MTLKMVITSAMPDGYLLNIEMSEHADTLEEAHDLQSRVEDAFYAWLINNARPGK